MRFFKNNSINALFIILLIVGLILLPFRIIRGVTAVINGERPPRSARAITGHSILATYFEK